MTCLRRIPCRAVSNGLRLTLVALLLTTPHTVGASERTVRAAGDVSPGQPTAAPGSHHGHHHHHDHGMTFDAEGMVMNANAEKLPGDCREVAGDHEIEVRAGTKYAAGFPDTVFGMNAHEWRVPPCSRVRVTFINEDAVRHQWMVHGLPRYLYPQGMFHLEAAGGATKTGVFIVPSDHRTYLVHCDLAQHMERGMKGQLVVGNGSGNLPSIPGVSAPLLPR